MKIITRKEPVVLENTVEGGEYFSLNIHPNNMPSIQGEPAKVGFQLVFPADCEVIRFSENSIIIWRKLPKEE